MAACKPVVLSQGKKRLGDFMIANYVKAGLVCLCALGMSNNSVAQTSGTPIKNIVPVHGAWADVSGWKGVYDILVKDGFNVSIVQEPETSFQDDVAATKRVIAQQDGQCILVAHGYGGAVVTEAGTDPSVFGLVYVAGVSQMLARMRQMTESAFQVTSARVPR
jgi:hypothetical protein